MDKTRKDRELLGLDSALRYFVDNGDGFWNVNDMNGYVNDTYQFMFPSDPYSYIIQLATDGFVIELEFYKGVDGGDLAKKDIPKLERAFQISTAGIIFFSKGGYRQQDSLETERNEKESKKLDAEIDLMEINKQNTLQISNNIPIQSKQTWISIFIAGLSLLFIIFSVVVASRDKTSTTLNGIREEFRRLNINDSLGQDRADKSNELEKVKNVENDSLKDKVIE